MNIKDKQYRTIWQHPDHGDIIQVIDQRQLPHKFVIADLATVDDVFIAIRDMWVRGAPLIGAAAAWGLYLAASSFQEGKDREKYFTQAYRTLIAARPTAVNLKWALDNMMDVISNCTEANAIKNVAAITAQKICDDDVRNNFSIGEYGVALLQEIADKKKGPVNILTHCNAGWLATVDRGTATAPIYRAMEKNIDVHVYVSETRPRNQGALTAWEFIENHVPHTFIADNAAGYLMQNGKIDIVLVGTDRTSATGDVVNKIGTYLKALAAYDNHVPFYVAAPSSSIDWNMRDAESEIIIEQRNPDEVKYVQGLFDGKIISALVAPEDSAAENYAFDITPSKYITGIITEKGICEASEEGLKRLFNKQTD